MPKYRKKRRRNPADIIQFPGQFKSPEDREAEEAEQAEVRQCVDELKQELAGWSSTMDRNSEWDENDQEIAEKQFCPIKIHVEEISDRVYLSEISRSYAIRALMDSIFRLGKIEGQVMEYEIANKDFWAQTIFDLVSDIKSMLLVTLCA